MGKLALAAGTRARGSPRFLLGTRRIARDALRRMGTAEVVFYSYNGSGFKTLWLFGKEDFGANECGVFLAPLLCGGGPILYCKGGKKRKWWTATKFEFAVRIGSR